MRTPGSLNVPRYAGPTPPRAQQIPATALGLALAGGAMLAIAAAVTDNSSLALIAPAAAAGAMACSRWPVAAVTGVLFLTAAAGTINGFTPLPVRATADFLLLSLWIGVVWQFASGRRDRPLWLWPGLLAVILYVALTAFEVFAADDVSAGFSSFRLSIWPMMAFLLVAVAPWRNETLVRIARWAIVVAVVIGVYNLFRWVVGPAAEEVAVARAAFPNLPKHIALRFFGSMGTAQNLAGWCAAMIPFALTMALVWRGRWRLAAGAAVGMAAFALVASSVLTGTFAALAGAGTAIVLYALAVAFPGGQRLAAGVLATAALVVTAGGAYGIAISGSAESESKFSHFLDPTSDPTFEKRTQRWEEALADIDEHPFGRGLGASGAIGKQQELIDPVASPNLDSSYLKIAFEQGMPVMLLYVAALVTLLVALARRALTTADPTRAALAIAACGTLVALGVQFFAGFYSEHQQTIVGWLIVGLGVAQFTSDRRDAGDRDEPATPAPAER